MAISPPLDVDFPYWMDTIKAKERGYVKRDRSL
jgi:hypothetical protein